MKNREKLLKNQREKYAKNLELKEKKKKIYQKNKEKIKKKNKELRTYVLSCIGAENDQRNLKRGITPNILHKSTNTIEELNNIFDKSVILC